MFEIGWTEMLVIAVVMIVVVGPKDLPKMLRTFGRTAAKLRGMAGDFQKQFNEALKEAELDDVKKSVDALRSLNPAAEIRKTLNPFEQAAADVKAGVDQAMKPKSTPVPAEPLKNGATEMPGEPPAAEPLVATPAELKLPTNFPTMSDPTPVPASEPPKPVAVAELAKSPEAAPAAKPKRAPAKARNGSKATDVAPLQNGVPIDLGAIAQPEAVAAKPRVSRPAGSRKKPASPAS